MSLTKPIPQKLKERMEADPYYERCCVTNEPKWRVKIDWHHNFESYLHGNKGRVNEAWCILPLASHVHAMADRREVRELLDWIMLNRATDEILEHWSVFHGELKMKRDYLNTKLYENEINNPVLQPDQGRSLATIDF